MRVFIENQKFNMWWMRLLMVFVLMSGIVPLIIAFNQETHSDNATLIITLIAVLILVSAVFFILFTLKLKTRIDEKGVHYGFYPFKQNPRIIPWRDIQTIAVRTYNPIGEYGGWGIRVTWFGDRGKAFNVSGNIGIQLELTNSKRILIGTQKQAEAEAVIAHYTAKKESY